MINENIDQVINESEHNTMKQYGTAPGQNNYTPDFLQHFDQKDGGETIFLKRWKLISNFISRTSGLTNGRSFPSTVSLSTATAVTVSTTATAGL